uniref:Uncharacterized protein n=1 Tax=Avena sativa TaxID=4498 RepID=A0ACD5YAS4_AVESA
MEYRPRSSRPYYGPNNGYGYGGGYGNSNGHGHGGYADGHWNGYGYGYAGGQGSSSGYGYGYGGGDDAYGSRYVPYGRGAVPSYGAGPSSSRGQGLGWGANGYGYAGGQAWAPPILPEAMRAAEAAAGEVLLRLHPTEAAERRRHEIIAYVKRLIGTTFGCEVFTFGSVPLKTYLPDGDVDLTVLTNPSVDSAFIDDVYLLLCSEAQDDDAPFTIKKIGIINAKVKLIKCVIDNVVVDISFNQLGGVSTFSFLEMVDREVGRDHLFKKSIILIKAWCYHERNIHGSSRWLISTYALEILILYIFNIFHQSLHGPLEALYKFLEYYSKFDWANHCLTLNGPVPMPPWCNYNGFCRKPLNIMDPLKVDNNLGNSISLGNSVVIQDAFKCDARKLGQILKLPSELIPDAIYGFFTTTLNRHGRGQRSDIGECFFFQSMLDSGNGLGEDAPSLQNSYTKKDENRSPDSSLGQLTDKESGVKANMHQSLGLNNFKSHPSSSIENGNTYIDSISQHILTSSTRASSLNVCGSYPIIESNFTDGRQEKLQLPPFSPSNLLDLSGDLGLPLKCFRSVQYNLEALFDKLFNSIQQASLAGVLDENRFIQTLRSLSDTDGRKLSTAKSSQGTRDVHQQSITDAELGAPYQPLYGTHVPSNGFSLHPPGEGYQPWFQNTEDTPHTYGPGMYIPNMNFALPPRTDTLSNGFYPVHKKNYPTSLPYRPGDTTTHGTGTYIPKQPHEIWKQKPGYDKKENESQSDEVYPEEKPDRVSSCNGHAAVENALTNGEIKQVPTSETTENGEQRYENGLRDTLTRLPPQRISVPHYGGGGQGNVWVPSTGQSFPPAGTMGTPSVKNVNSQPITAQQYKNIEFGTFAPNFVEEFPPLAGTKKPVQATSMKSPKHGASTSKSWPAEASGSAVQSPRASVSVTQSRPVEAPASAAQSPEPNDSAAQCSSPDEESCRLKDDAEFPALQAGITRKKKR